MSFLTNWLDPARRFELEYAKAIQSQCESILWPGNTRIDVEREFIPVRGLKWALAGHKQVLLTGAAGSGKTTAIAHLALAHARALAAGERDAKAPIFLSARELASGHLPQRSDLPGALFQSPALTAQCPFNYWTRALSSGRALVLIDDLDVVPQDAMAGWLEQFAGVQIVATGKSPIAGLPVFPLPGFRDGDIATLVKSWPKQDSAAFWSALKSANVPRTLTASPMALSLLARVWRTGELGNGNRTVTSLPARRTALFDAYAANRLSGSADTIRTLQDAALAAMRGTPPSASLLPHALGFVQARNRGAEFAHELWQAYFAARALVQGKDTADAERLVSDPAWLDTLLFYAGLGDASDLASTLIASGNFVLAGRVAAHAGQIRSDLVDTITKELVRSAWDGDSGAVAALSEMNSDVAVQSLAERLKDPDPGVRGRAAQVMGELRLDRGIDFLLHQLRDPNSDVRDRIIEALGKAHSDRVVEPLLVALRGDPRVGRVDTRIRVAAAKALGEVGSDKAVPALVVDLQTGEPEVRTAAANSLKCITSRLVYKPLLGIKDSGDEAAREHAADVLQVLKERN